MRISLKYLKEAKHNLFVISNGISLTVAISIVKSYNLVGIYFILLRDLDLNYIDDDRINIIIFDNINDFTRTQDILLNDRYNLFIPHLMHDLSRLLSKKCRNLFFIEEGSNNFWSHIENEDKWKYNSLVYRNIHRFLNIFSSIPTTLSIFDYHHPKYRFSFSLSDYTFINTNKIKVKEYKFHNNIKLDNNSCIIVPSKVKDTDLFKKEIRSLSKYLGEYDTVYIKLHPHNSNLDVLEFLQQFKFILIDSADLLESYIPSNLLDVYSNYSSALLYSVIWKLNAFRYNIIDEDYDIGNKIDSFIKHNNFDRYYKRIILH